MENLIFCLNATVPIFLTMMAGLFFRKIGLFNESFITKMNQFVFKVALPVLLFQDISGADFYEVWNGRFVLYCFVVTLTSILLVTILSCFLKDHSLRGEFIQGSYRSSAAILGIAFMQNIYGDAGMAPLMIIGSVPLYNMMAVIVLSVFGAEKKKIDERGLENIINGQKSDQAGLNRRPLNLQSNALPLSYSRSWFASTLLLLLFQLPPSTFRRKQKMTDGLQVLRLC